MTLCNPWTAVLQTSLSFIICHSFLRLMSFESVMPSSHLILFHSLLLLCSISPSIRVFSNESAFRIRWSKYWSFSFNISPSNEYSGWFPLGLTGLISFSPAYMIFFKLVFSYFPNIIRFESKPTRSYCPVLLDDSFLGRNFEDLLKF